MSKIKLLKVDEMQDGTQRFQSQLLVGKDTVDFIMRNDGIMRCYCKGDKGFQFYEYKEPYEIAESKKDMVMQPL